MIKNKLFKVLLGILVLSLFYLSIFIAGFKTFAVFLIVLFLFILPGILISLRLVRNGFPYVFEILLFGITGGFAFSCLFILLIGYFVKWDVYTVLFFLLLFSSILSYFCLRKPGITKTIKVNSAWSYNDLCILIFTLIVVLGAIAYPLMNVGRLTDKGYAYAAMFGHDFILRVSFCASIADHVPPDYLNYSGLKLDTYWIFYAFSGFIHLILKQTSSLKNIFLLSVIFQSMLFICLLTSLLKLFLKNSKSLLLSLMLTICAYSYFCYYALLKEQIFKLVKRYFPAFLGAGNFDHYPVLSHSYFRDFLIEPHALLAVSLMIIAIWIISNAKKHPLNKILSFVIGGLAGLSFGTDAFLGLIFIAWFGLIVIIEAMREKRKIFSYFASFVYFCAPVALMALLYKIIGMYSYSRGTSGLLVFPYKSIILVSPLYFLIEYGPMIVFALFCLVLIYKKKINFELRPILVLCIFTLFIILFIRHRYEINLGLRKGIIVMQIPLLIFSGILFDYLISNKKKNKRNWRMIYISMFLALPTLITDIYAASNIYDPKNATYVSVADYKACQWIKTKISEKAIVQCEPEYPSVYGYSLISCFAERKMVVGESMLGKTLHKLDGVVFSDKRTHDVQLMFRTQDVGIAIDIIKKYLINYIYVGKYETELYPDGVTKFELSPNYFKKVYAQNGISIYKTIVGNE